MTFFPHHLSKPLRQVMMLVGVAGAISVSLIGLFSVISPSWTPGFWPTFSGVSTQKAVIQPNQESLAEVQTESAPGQVLGERTPSIYVYGGDRSFSSGGLIAMSSEAEPMVEVGGSNIQSNFKADLFRASQNHVLQYLEYNDENQQRNQTVDKSSMTFVTSLEISPPSSGNPQRVQLPLDANGIYYLELSNAQLTVSSYIVRSDFGAIAKEGDGEIIIWSQDFKSLRRLPNVSFAAYKLHNGLTQITSGQTDQEGLARIPISQLPDLAVLTHNGQISILPFNLQYLSSWGSSDYRYYPYEQRQQSKFFLFTDRPLYRPGDKIYFKSVVRNEDDVRYSIPSGNAAVKLYKGYGDDEQVIFSQNINISSEGTVEGEIDLPADMATDYYNLEVALSENLKTTSWLQVEHFRKPEYTVEVDSHQHVYIMGDEVGFDISGSYFSGQPLAGQTVNYSVLSSNYYSYDSVPQEVSNDYRYGSYWGGGGSEITKGEVVLDEEGKAQLRIPSRNPNLGYNQVYTISIDYEDATGNPTFDYRNVLVLDGEFGIYRQRDTQYYYQVGQASDLKVEVKPNFSGVNVSNLTLTGTVERTEWVRYQDPNRKYPSYQEVKENLPGFTVVTDAQGQANIAFTPSKPGSYNFSVQTKDKRGNEVRREFYIYVSNQSGQYFTGPSQELFQLSLDKETYQPTDTVNATLTSSFPFRDVLLTFERDRVNRYQVVSLNQEVTKLQLPLTGTDIPNIFLTVSGLSGSYIDQVSENIKVNSDSKEMQIKITPDKQVYGPSDDVTLNVQTTDHTGKPLAADLAVWAIDKAIFELATQRPNDIFKAFWSERFHNTTTTHSLTGISVTAAERGGGGGGETRTTFKDTAYWNPHVRTNSNGQAQVSFKLPDNLTTWVIAAVGATLDTVVGDTKEEIMVAKSIVVRPVLPNILQIGDKVVIQAIVHNFSNQTQEFDISASFEAGEISTPSQATAQVEPNKSVTVEWTILPQTENPKAKITFSAKSKNNPELADTIVQEIPVQVFGFMEEIAQVGHGDISYQVSLPTELDKEKSSLSIQLASSISSALPQAIEYLIDYPYGCVEQTTSRFVPTVIAAADQELFADIVAGKDLDKYIAVGVSGLKDMQKSDGGWSWWSHGESDLFISVYVLEYLLKAQTLGYEVDDNMLNAAKNYFEQIPENQLVSQSVARSYGLALLDSDKKYLVTNFENMTPDILAMAVMSNTIQGQTNPQANGLNSLMALAQTQGSETFWSAGNKKNFGSIPASTALASRAILLAGGDSETVSSAMRYLLQHRNSYYWGNTFGTAQVIQAVSDYAKSTQELNPDYTYQVNLDGVVISRGQVTNARQVIKPIEVPLDSVKESGSQIQISRSGTGEVYSNVLQKNFSTDRNAASLDHGLTITREYVNETKEGYTPGLGDYVSVRLTVSGLKTEDNYLVIHDQLPSGMIPVNTNLENQQQNSTSITSFSGGQVEFTQNGAIISLYNSYPGSKTYQYRARVISQGEFTIPPATASLMYSPDIYGRTGVEQIKIGKVGEFTPQVGKQVKEILKAPTIDELVLAGIMGLILIGIGGFIYYRQSRRSDLPIPPTPPLA